MTKNLQQLFDQLKAIWKELGVRQRIVVISAAALVLGGLLTLAFWSSRADYQLLYGRLDDAEAAKVVEALNEAKVPYQIGAGGGAIYVPADKVHAMRMQLAGHGIPRGDGVGFEIFDKPNFGISDFVQRANYIRAVQGELARTISQLNEIDFARVMIVMPENRLLVDDNKQPTASVFVRVKGATLQPSSVQSIQFLVANAVAGLQPQNVSVVDNHGNVLSSNSGDDSISGLTSSQLAARRDLESYLGKKAEGLLERVLGPGQSVVRVAAEINFDTITRTEENYDPESQVIRTSTVTDENTDTITANSSGAAGIATNANTETNTVASTPATNTRLRKKTTNNDYEINKTTSNILQTAGGIKRLTAAVFVASRYEGEGADRKPVPRNADELDKLRRIVQSALGIQNNGESAFDGEVTLEEISFNDKPLVDLTEQFQKQERVQLWWDVARTLIYPLFGFGVLVFFWRAFKRTPVEPIPIGIPLAQIEGNGHDGPLRLNKNGHTNGNGSNGHGHRAFNGNGHTASAAPGVITPDVLNQLIRENPDNMTQAIRSWLTRGKSSNN